MTASSILWPMSPGAKDISNSPNDAHDPTAPIHYLMLGTSCKGKSVLLKKQARALGISYDELLERMGPTPEVRDAVAQHRTERQSREQARLRRVAQAYWQGTAGLPGDDLTVLHEALVLAQLCERPTKAQCHALFLMLPATVIGQGIAWGFDDTEVRESVYSFVDDNLKDVARALQAARAAPG